MDVGVPDGTRFIDEPVREHLYTDDVRMICDMIEDEWALGADDRPEITYIPEDSMVDARQGMIFVYMVSRRNTPSTIDYRTLQRSTRIAIKMSTRHRDTMFEWSDELYRILMANRRTGKKRLNGNTYLEVLGDRPMQDLSGWYSTTFDIQLTSYATPIRSAGFGNEINKEIDDWNREVDRQ